MALPEHKPKFTDSKPTVSTLPQNATPPENEGGHDPRTVLLNWQAEEHIRE